jgi:hypothetical protein
MRSFWLIAVLAAAADLALAEPGPRAAEGYAQPPYLAARITRISASPVLTDEGGAAELEPVEQQLRLGIARAEFGAYTVDVGLDYQYSRYEYAGIDSRNRDLHRLQLPLVFRGTQGRWYVEGFVAPGVSASSNVFKDPFDRWSGEDLQLSAAVEGHYPLDAKWRLVAGIAHDRSFGKSQLYPLAGVLYRPDRDFSLRLAFPDVELQFAPTDRQQLTARVYPAGHLWHVVSDSLDRDFNYRMRALRSEATWSLRLWSGLTLDLSVGYENRRRHRFTDDRGIAIDADVDDQWLLSIGLRAGQAPLPHAHGQRR